MTPDPNTPTKPNPIPALLIRITAPHFVAGAEVEGGKVIKTAPIIGYMKGWAMAKVKGYCNYKEWRFEVLP
jgi:hypothetical protein